MKKYYFSFLLSHFTESGVYLGDKIVEIIAPGPAEARELMFKIFDDKWGFMHELPDLPDLLLYGKMWKSFEYGVEYDPIKVIISNDY